MAKGLAQVVYACPCLSPVAAILRHGTAVLLFYTHIEREEQTQTGHKQFTPIPVQQTTTQAATVSQREREREREKRRRRATAAQPEVSTGRHFSILHCKWVH